MRTREYDPEPPVEPTDDELRELMEEHIFKARQSDREASAARDPNAYKTSPDRYARARKEAFSFREMARDIWQYLHTGNDQEADDEA